MHKTLGEWILQQLMTPDRATAIVGDLEQNDVGPMQFWLAIGSNILHAISPAVLLTAGKGFLAQFAFSILFTPILTLVFLRVSDTRLKWIEALVMLAVQILTGFWIARQRLKQPVLICMFIVIADCALGLLGVNNVSINMLFWAIPLPIATAAVVRNRSRARLKA